MSQQSNSGGAAAAGFGSSGGAAGVVANAGAGGAPSNPAGAGAGSSSAGGTNVKNEPIVTPEPHVDDPGGSSDSFHSWRHMTRTLAHYERYEQIGEGTYGQVYRAKCRDTGRMVALKKMRMQHASVVGMPQQFIREIKILKRLQHPNLLKMIEVVTSKGVEYLDQDDEDPDERGGGKNSGTGRGKGSGDPQGDRAAGMREAYKGNLFLVLEYVSHDLTGLMDVAYEFTAVQVKSIMKQLLEAISYMHEQKYVHRDIKSSNILLDDRFRVKLADFGLARCIEPPILDQMHDRASSLQLTNKVITLWYRPPEILVGATSYGGAVDVWSAGCILAELLLGKPLFAGKTEMDQLNLIIDLLGTPSPDTWDHLSTFKRMRSGEMTIDLGKPKQSRLRAKYKTRMDGVTLNLLEKLLEWDPRKRMTAATALQQRFFRTPPVAPADPSELGQIQLASGGHFHEFQTKKKRREAKAVAEKAKADFLKKGYTESEARAEFDRIYRGLMKKAADEGLGSMSTEPAPIRSKPTGNVKREAALSAPTNKPEPSSGKSGSRGGAEEREKKSSSSRATGDRDRGRDRDRDRDRHHRSSGNNDEDSATSSRGRREKRRSSSRRDRDRDDDSTRRRDSKRRRREEKEERRSSKRRDRSLSSDRGGGADPGDGVAAVDRHGSSKRERSRSPHGDRDRERRSHHHHKSSKGERRRSSKDRSSSHRSSRDRKKDKSSSKAAQADYDDSRGGGEQYPEGSGGARREKKRDNDLNDDRSDNSRSKTSRRADRDSSRRGGDRELHAGDYDDSRGGVGIAGADGSFEGSAARRSEDSGRPAAAAAAATNATDRRGTSYRDEPNINSDNYGRAADYNPDRDYRYERGGGDRNRDNRGNRDEPPGRFRGGDDWGPPPHQRPAYGGAGPHPPLLPPPPHQRQMQQPRPRDADFDYYGGGGGGGGRRYPNDRGPAPPSHSPHRRDLQRYGPPPQGAAGGPGGGPPPPGGPDRGGGGRGPPYRDDRGPPPPMRRGPPMDRRR